VPPAAPLQAVAAPVGRLVDAVDAILRRPDEFSVGAAARELSPEFGGSEWAVCLDIMQAVGLLHTRPQ
jgi:hypothetical protein